MNREWPAIFYSFILLSASNNVKTDGLSDKDIGDIEKRLIEYMGMESTKRESRVIQYAVQKKRTKKFEIKPNSRTIEKKIVNFVISYNGWEVVTRKTANILAMAFHVGGEKTKANARAEEKSKILSMAIVKGEKRVERYSSGIDFDSYYYYLASSVEGHSQYEILDRFVYSHRLGSIESDDVTELISSLAKEDLKEKMGTLRMKLHDDDSEREEKNNDCKKGKKSKKFLGKFPGCYKSRNG